VRARAIAAASALRKYRSFGNVKPTQSVYAFITTIATSVRFFAFNFLMTLRERN
jgi:hypothetical protein